MNNSVYLTASPHDTGGPLVSTNNITDYELQVTHINNIVYYSLMIPLAVCGNVFTLTAVIMVLKIKASIPNLLIGVLACTDLVSILTCHLIAMASMAQGQYIGSAYVCHFQSMMAYTYFKMGFLTKCCISFDRYIALAYPLKYRRLVTMKRMVAVIIHNVIFSFGTSALTLIIDPEYIHLLPTSYMCVNDFQYVSTYKTAITITEGAIFFLGVILFLVSNLTVIKVMFELNQKGKKLFSIGKLSSVSTDRLKNNDNDSEENSIHSTDQVQPSENQHTQSEEVTNNNDAPKISNITPGGGQRRKSSVDILTDKLKNWSKAYHKVAEKVKVEKKQHHRQKRELQFAKLVMVIVTVFAVLWIPYMTVIYWEQHNQRPAPALVEDIVIKLVFANCCFNPLIYGVFNANFRRAYVYYLRMMAFYFTCKLTKKPQGIAGPNQVHQYFTQRSRVITFLTKPPNNLTSHTETSDVQDQSVVRSQGEISAIPQAFQDRTVPGQLPDENRVSRIDGVTQSGDQREPVRDLLNLQDVEDLCGGLQSTGDYKKLNVVDDVYQLALHNVYQK